MNTNLREHQRGLASIAVFVALAALVGIGSATYYYYSPKRPIGIPVSPPTDNQDTAWQEYVNPKYNYKINYPSSWFFHQTGFNPPPPATIRLSNIGEGLGPVGNEISIEILSLEDPGENLDTNAEIQSLSSQGFNKKKTTISGEPAIVMERGNDEGGTDTSIYLYRQGNVYRLSWGLWNVEIKRLYGETLQKIVDSFKFTN